MESSTLPKTGIHVLRDVPLGRVKHAVFDFDGTVSLLRRGWQGIMGPFMLETICGGAEPTDEIRKTVEDYIEESTGIQTILQMERLVEMVAEAGLVGPADRAGAQEYKARYNAALMVPVRERIERIERGERTIADELLRGVRDTIVALAEREVTLYLASGTDVGDVRDEAELLGVADYFAGGIWGALRTFEEYSKEKVIRAILEDNALEGPEVVVVGDGPVEIRNAKQFDCIAVGVASNEWAPGDWDEAKRRRLTAAGADLLMPDFVYGVQLAERLTGR